MCEGNPNNGAWFCCEDDDPNNWGWVWCEDPIKGGEDDDPICVWDWVDGFGPKLGDFVDVCEDGPNPFCEEGLKFGGLACDVW